MPEFRLRSWAEQTLFGSRDYIVTADSLEDALKKLRDAQEEADFQGKWLKYDNIRSAGKFRIDEVIPLDPEEVVDGTNGVTLIGRNGRRERDLIGVPTGCVQLGDPLEGE